MKDYNQIICEAYKLIIESRGSADINIPRPNRLKTPPNTYGSSGQNAREYDIYVQDQAEEVYQDKYGKEKGTKAWEGIINVGNAMFKACDQILGEKRTMTDIVARFNSDTNTVIDHETWLKAMDSYICLWCAWILSQKARGVNYTQDFLSECIPTFKGVIAFLPGFLEPYLHEAEIDINNFALSKKVQTSIDLKEKVRQQLAALDAVEQQQKQTVATNTKTMIDTFVNALPNAAAIKANTKYNNYIYDRISILIDSKALTKLIKYEFNGQKDNDRIVNMLRKSLRDEYKNEADVMPWMIDISKARNFADNMNAAITDEGKRNARKKAAEDLGVKYIADRFTNAVPE